MTLLRRLFRDHPALAAWLVVVALAMKILVPGRFMPVVANGVLTAAAGLTALGLRDTASGGVGAFTFTVAVWAAVTGILELVVGLRSRGRIAAARDWIAVGALTAILALVYVLLPLDPVTAVGLLGAYFVVLGVLLLIGGFSLKWAAAGPVGTGDAASGSERS